LRGTTDAEGALQATQRTTVHLADRAIAVADEGAVLNWQVDANGEARVEQRAGYVFYRVELGGRFEVDAGLARIQVTGTSFGVLLTAPNRLDVEVHEGAVVVSSERGEVSVGAGRRTTVLGDTLPSVPADLRAKGTAERLAGVATRVQPSSEHTDSAPAPGPERSPVVPDGLEPSLESLQERAEDCRLQFDVPPIDADGVPELLDGETIEAFAITDAERRTILARYADFNAAAMEELRALYVEATGNEAMARLLSFEALGIEIRRKSIPEDVVEARRTIALELAGELASPRDRDQGPPIERYFRLLTKLGQEAETLLGDVIGPQRAREIRGLRGGWPLQSGDGGCTPRRTLMFPL
jgi:hypothetical protein